MIRTPEEVVAYLRRHQGWTREAADTIDHLQRENKRLQDGADALARIGDDRADKIRELQRENERLRQDSRALRELLQSEGVSEARLRAALSTPGGEDG